MIQSSYVPLDTAAAINDHGEIVQSGETCRIDALKDNFAWMRGFVNAWYGWSSDGKGTMLDFLTLIKSKRDNWKWCLYKMEDMDTVITPNGPVIKANRIYQNLAWSLTGKTWNKAFSDKYKTPMMTMHELQEALEFVTEHFYVIYPQDRSLKSILETFKMMYEKFGIDGFVLDPWNVVKLPENNRTDQQLVEAFIDCKEFAMNTNTVFNIVNHARSLNDVKDKDGRYKVVNQFMQLGGSAWDIKMDMQMSIYRPERHLNPSDPKVHLYNLKTRQGEIVGVDRGSYEKIVFDRIKKQYYFDGVNPMTGEIKGDRVQSTMNFSQPTRPDSDEALF